MAKEAQILRERRSRFVEIFRTTPTRTVCPNFFVLAHANGCHFRPHCNYCYLQSSLWHQDRPHVFTNVADMEGEIARWIARNNPESVVLNSGNLSDSLSFEKIRPMMPRLIALFREHAEARNRPHSLLVVTKGGWRECESFLAASPCANILISFSVNHPDAAQIFEAGAAPPAERLETARELSRQGWRVRLRIDPMIQGYDYSRLCAEAREVGAERVTLGTLRAEPSLFRFIRNGVLVGLEPAEDPKGLARYPFSQRVALYRQAIADLGDACSVGLCEETPEVWEAAGLDSSIPLCNCSE